MLGEDTRLKIATETTSKTVINTTTTTTTTTAATTTTTPPSNTNDSETAVGEGAASTTRIINDPFWGKRPPERIGSAANDGYFVEDKSEVKLNLNTYKMVFVMNKDVLFYKKNSLRKAKQVGDIFIFTSSNPIVNQNNLKKKSHSYSLPDAFDCHIIDVKKIPQFRIQLEGQECNRKSDESVLGMVYGSASRFSYEYNDTAPE